MISRKTFLGEFTDPNGDRHPFFMPADSHEHAEALLVHLADNGEILGEMVDEGEVDGAFGMTVGTA